MRSRSLAISAGVHGAAAALLALVGGAVHVAGESGEAGSPREIPVEIVPPRRPSPPVEAALALASAPAPAPAPPSARPPHPAPRALRAPALPSLAPGAPLPAPAAPAAGGDDDGDAATRRSEAPAPPSGDLASGSAADGSGSRGAAPGPGGSGAGGAGGSGTGGTGPAVDLSKRPVPLNAASQHVLPYTADALRKRITGDVRLVLHVDARGTVAATTFRQRLGHGLDEIAAEAARKIRFQPARDPLGRPTAGDVLWRFHFAPP